MLFLVLVIAGPRTCWGSGYLLASISEENVHCQFSILLETNAFGRAKIQRSNSGCARVLHKTRLMITARQPSDTHLDKHSELLRQPSHCNCFCHLANQSLTEQGSAGHFPKIASKKLRATYIRIPRLFPWR